LNVNGDILSGPCCGQPAKNLASFKGLVRVERRGERRRAKHERERERIRERERERRGRRFWG
jgi:hypothetical protein